jgi:transposase
LSVLLTGGQAHDTTRFIDLLAGIRFARPAGPGRPRTRTRPARVLADKAYSSRAIRRYLRGRGIIAVIPERREQQDNRRRRGRAGGRPLTFDREAYKRRNVVDRCFNRLKQYRAIATRHDKPPSPTKA